MNQPMAHEVESKVSSEHSPWQVSQLSKSLKDWIEKLGRVWVEGELQQLQVRGSNIFGSLRDLDVENSIEIHAFDASSAEIEAGLSQGDRVVALLQPQFWAKNGKLTMRVLKMHKVGLGELLERIEKLRQLLISEGLADPARKKPLPFLPAKIGLITGSRSDAEKDILQNAKLRWPEVQFEVINTLVQGDKAPAEIIMAMQQLDQMPDVDIIIIARGGGSFQDLLPFSDERLVRAAAALTKPVVSAIGHENDSPLLDLVADLRASTPTDAAKRVVPDVVEERRGISQARERLALRIGSFIENQMQLIDSILSRPVLAKSLRLRRATGRAARSTCKETSRNPGLQSRQGEKRKRSAQGPGPLAISAADHGAWLCGYYRQRRQAHNRNQKGTELSNPKCETGNFRNCRRG
jgi:exodeoxyribonuclease VII large subunit